MNLNFEIPTNPWAECLDWEWACEHHVDERISVDAELFHRFYKSKAGMVTEVPTIETLMKWRKESRHDIFTMCPKCAQVRMDRPSLKWLTLMEVPHVLLMEDFETYKAHKSLTEAMRDEYVERCMAFAKQRLGLFVITGDTGTGKDHLAVSILKEMRRHRYDVNGKWITELDLGLQVRDTYSKGGTLDLLRMYSEQMVLVISDLQYRSKGDDLDQHLHWILDRRYQNKLPTIVTSNVYVEPTETHDAMSKVFSERLASRSQQMLFDHVIIKSKDVRHLAKQKYFKS